MRLEAVGDALAEWRHGSACIRVAGDDLDDNEIPLADALGEVLQALRLAPHQVDLLLDFGVVDEQSVSITARVARLVLGEIPDTEAWRTLTCASGGFPANLDAVQAQVLTELPRHDAAMWRTVRDRVRSRTPSFGDYAISYPAQTGSAPFAPAPQLRYTSASNWLIYKGRKRDRRGAAQFYDICGRMVSTGVVNPDISWGDRYVDEAAREQDGGERGPGNAMIWRAIGTSHHLGYVVNRLATLGEP